MFKNRLRPGKNLCCLLGVSAVIFAALVQSACLLGPFPAKQVSSLRDAYGSFICGVGNGDNNDEKNHNSCCAFGCVLCDVCRSLIQPDPAALPVILTGEPISIRHFLMPYCALAFFNQRARAPPLVYG